MIQNLIRDLKKVANPKRAKASMRFFKTEKGSYGFGDVFLGITVPKQRDIAKQYLNLSLKDIKVLLRSRFHEHRLVALIILVDQYKRAGEREREKIFKFYLACAARINNWDLVDLSAPYIPGVHLRTRSKKILYEFARSENLWKKRIAMISTLGLMRDGQLTDTLKIAKILLHDKHDLIHKAVGWMLRVLGDISRPTEEKFLQKYRKLMPRTTLRYAIEKMPRQKRLYYLK